MIADASPMEEDAPYLSDDWKPARWVDLGDLDPARTGNVWGSTYVSSLVSLLTVEQAAEALSVSTKTIYRLLDKGELGGVKTSPGKSGHWRIPPAELASWVERNTVARTVHDIEPWQST